MKSLQLSISPLNFKRKFVFEILKCGSQNVDISNVLTFELLESF